MNTIFICVFTANTFFFSYRGSGSARAYRSKAAITTILRRRIERNYNHVKLSLASCISGAFYFVIVKLLKHLFPKFHFRE